MLSFLRQERKVVLLALFLLVTLAWLYVVWLKLQMNASMGGSASMDVLTHAEPMTSMVAEQNVQSGLVTLATTFTMWFVMMVAMMLPSAAPMILLFTALRSQTPSSQSMATFQFTGAYLLVWAVFSLIVSVLQIQLHQTHILSDMMVSRSAQLNGTLLIIAGLWQWSPWKQSCLQACRGPTEFLSQHYKKGRAAVFRLGLKHGLFCLGCCWAIMLLLFVAGVMNILWIAILSAFVLIEKTFPFGKRFGLISSVMMIVSGGYIFLLQ